MTRTTGSQKSGKSVFVPDDSWGTLLAVSAFFALTLLFFGPAYIYFTNSLEFNLSFREILPWLLGATFVLCAILTLILRGLGSGLRQKGLALLFVLGLLLWIQGNLLVWDYGPLDGREIHWNAMWLKGLVDSAVWLLFIVLAFKKSAWFVKIARTAAFAFIAIQIISVSMALMRAPKTPSFKRYYIDESHKYQFSAQKNVIILMLDTFQSDLFQEIITANPEYKEIFRGFTYFRNALSSFPKTYTSVPSFLTAHVYDNSVPMEDFLQKAYASNSSLPRLLKEAGFQVDLFPMPHTEKTIYFSDSVASNIKKRQSGGGVGQDLGFLVDITLFRHIPHFTKRFVYNDQSWLLKRLWAKSIYTSASPAVSIPNSSSFKQTQEVKHIPRFSKEAMQLGDVQFIKQLLTQATVSASAPVFKYFHLSGLHRPLVLDEHLEVKAMSTSQRSSFATQGKACLQIARLMIEKLKVLGLYDNSLIIVMADHGCADYTYGVNVASAGFSEVASTVPSVPPHIKAAGLPMVLIKPIAAPAEELKIVDVPVLLTDLPRTITMALGMERTMPGMSMFLVPEKEPRPRQFYYYNWSGWVDGYLYHMREYAVNGHSWLDSSWREIGIIQPATAKKPYLWNTVVQFSPQGSGMLYQGIGWHEAQTSGFTWTREKRVELFLTVAPPQKDIILEMTLKPFLVKGKLDQQEVTVWVSNRAIKTLLLTNPEMAVYRVIIPRGAVVGSKLSIVFQIPTATAPVDLNIGSDVRDLGFALQSMVLKQ